MAYSTPIGCVGRTVLVTRPLRSSLFKASARDLCVIPSKRRLISLKREGLGQITVSIRIVHLSSTALDRRQETTPSGVGLS